jgi:hypothetical protein
MAKPAASRPDLETRLRAEVDRAVAPYEGKVPPYVLAKLREIAERYWREHPQASRILHMAVQQDRIVSGTEPTGAVAASDDAARAGGTRKEGA